MCFSIRPTEVKRFRTVLRCDVDLSLRVLASLRNRPHRPFHDGIRRTKWNNLQGVLCAHEAQGTAHAPNSLRLSSREGQLSASTRKRINYRWYDIEDCQMLKPVNPNPTGNAILWYNGVGDCFTPSHET